MYVCVYILFILCNENIWSRAGDGVGDGDGVAVGVQPSLGLGWILLCFN